MNIQSSKTRPVIIKNSYPQLLKELRSHLETGQRAVEYNQALTYWKVGSAISKYILKGKDRAGYAEHLYERLGKDLNVGAQTLVRSVKFSREFPIPSPETKLGWMHYRALLGVQDEAKRRSLILKITKEHLSRRGLEAEIKKIKPAVKKDLPQPQDPPPKLSVKRGQLYSYRIFESQDISPDKLLVDCGFSTYLDIPLNGISKPQTGQILLSNKADSTYRFTGSTVKKSEIYTYVAKVERIVDGDTPWVNIDCGFGIWLRQKLRLKGIDTPEMNTPEGLKAKQFVEKMLGPCDFIVIKTYSSDKYDRYLVDIFFEEGESDASVVAKRGRCLNQELLDHYLAVKM